jgi:hypothetical protein
MKTVKHIIYASVAVATAVVLSLSVRAQDPPNLLVDGNFQAEGAANAFDQPNPIPLPSGISGGWAGWTCNLTSTYAPPSSGYSVYVWENTWDPEGVYQILPATAGYTYTLSALALDTKTPDWTTPVILQLNFYDPTGTDELASTGNWEAGPSQVNTWQQVGATTATAPAGTALVEAYVMYMDSDSGAQGMYFGNVSLTAVPEPSTIALVACGLLGMLVIRRRQA